MAMPKARHQRSIMVHSKLIKPLYEWKQEDNQESLLIYLPGFRKESIKVTTKDAKNLRVLGERMLAGDKLDRFVEYFKVPESCKLSEIRTKYDGRILTITLPRKIINAPTTTETAKPQKSMKTAKQNKDLANPSSSNFYANRPPLIPITKGDGDDLPPPLEGVTKPKDEEKPYQKPLEVVIPAVVVVVVVLGVYVYYAIGALRQRELSSI